jgi:hypothetical protein
MDRHFHYRKAEECAEWAHQLLLTEEGSQDAAVWAAIAQAHATLARTATEAPANTTWPKPPAETRRRVIPTPTEIELGEAKNPPPPRLGTGVPPTEASWQPPVSPPQIRPLSRRTTSASLHDNLSRPAATAPLRNGGCAS